MSNRPIFVATHPRACSTAFERVFMTQRKTLRTIHEPFGDAFYYGTERMGSRFENDEEARKKSGFAESNYKTIFDHIMEAAEGKRVLIKDMAYYIVPPDQQEARLAPSLLQLKRGVGTEEDLNEQGGLGLRFGHDSGVDVNAAAPKPSKSPPFPFETRSEPGNPTVIPREILERFHFTFLIRHPRSSIPSFYRCCVPPLLERTGFHDFMSAEAGYDELRRLFDYCKDTGLVGPKVCSPGNSAPEQTNGHVNGSNNIEICVIDADDLLDDPEGVLRKYCQSIGIEFSPQMLVWDDEEDHKVAKQAFEKWNGWHDDALHSKDLKPRQHKHKKTDEEQYSDWVERYGKDAAETIKKCVADNVATYEYLKQYAIQV
ncbi:hypothetical protein BAUCODRAFT_78570 [Baudoinia panamericana UAMH 10762]|uniref:Sulfotransferase domain-containing protein n=1 Tax=Baudoinia panamericana (strain UAMH 10762) TaxID=717646 RepID=M2N0G3_BAUPA|nr:uncharacterized protein BAUCODRAFT_78570 [Baudoinia panamericana UAMH 10762]EMC92085.1 hypothetical protein BAUCODRAFT_78570 [Baudoinia panamericana UAMH 10762]